MRKKRIIISVVAAVCVLVGVFFVMRFGVIGRIYNAISRYVVQNKAESEKEGPEELKYETWHDKDGNEYVVELRKVTGAVDEEGNEVEMWEDTAEGKTIYDNGYEGIIEKIEDNKIYFTVDKKEKEGSNFIFEDVEDYQVVFDIDTYNLDRHADSFDSLCFVNGDFLNGVEFFYSTGELEFLVGEYLYIQDIMNEDAHTGERYKYLGFYLQ